jgi:hypothetical protein
LRSLKCADFAITEGENALSLELLLKVAAEGQTLLVITAEARVVVTAEGY